MVNLSEYNYCPFSCLYKALICLFRYEIADRGHCGSGCLCCRPEIPTIVDEDPVKPRLIALFALSCTLLVNSETGVAGESNLLGNWRLAIKANRQGGPFAKRWGVDTGILDIEKSSEGIRAYIDGGPVSLSIDGQQITIGLDYSDTADRVRMHQLSGSIRDDVLQGTIKLAESAEPSSWWATRVLPTDTGELPPSPVDLSGTWRLASGGFHKSRHLLTPRAQAIVDNYKHMDDPANRCMSVGLVRMLEYPLAPEISQQEKFLKVLFRGENELRLIHLDSRGFPKQLEERPLGYAIGHWEGSTLVVETRGLAPLFIDQAGRPISSNARVVQRWSLSEDSEIMYRELMLHDPDNYARPISYSRTWIRDNREDYDLFDCDPHSFYRGLELDGDLEEYWSRHEFRR